MESKTLTIMFTDIKDFTRRTGIQSREEHLILLEKHESLILPAVKKFNGKIVKTLGDSFLVVFESPTNSVLCAMDIQKRLSQYNEGLVNADEKIEIRIGINAGEVNVANNDISGNPVNLASRVVSIAEVNNIFFTEAVYLTMNKSEIPHAFVGSKSLKGLEEAIKIYRVLLPGQSMPKESMLSNSVSNTSFSKAVDFDKESQFTEEKLDPNKIGEVFDFTNIEFEKKYDDSLSENMEQSSKGKDVEILELDSSKFSDSPEDPFEITQTEQSKQGLEHSKEILSTIRQEKSRKKTIIKISILAVLAFLVGLFFIYKNLTKEKQLKPEDLKKDSAVFEALEPEPEPTPEPTVKSRFKPVKSTEYGTLKITSKPSNASVYFNGRKLNKRTPMVLRKIEPDQSYRLSVSMKGYEPYEIFFDLRPGEERKINVKLSKK